MRNSNYLPVYTDGVEEALPKFLPHSRYSKLGFTHLLLNGFVPPPYSLIDGVKSIAPFDEMKVDYSYSDLFPKSSKSGCKFNMSRFEEIFYEYFKVNVPVESKVSILYSGGKDSTAIALLLSRLRSDVKVKLFFLNNPDEYERAKALSDSLGYEMEVIDVDWEGAVDAYSSMTYFCGDLSAPNYIVAQKAAEKWSSIIFDGSGNDLYSGHIPSRNDMIKYYLKRLVGNKLKYLHKFLPARFRFLARPASLIFTYNYFPVSSEVRGLNSYMTSEYEKYWNYVDNRFSDKCIEDYKVNTRGRFLDNFQIYTKTFSYEGSGQVFLPFCDKDIATYLSRLELAEKFTPGRNKEYLRKYLNKYLDYEGFPGGKQGMDSIFQRDSESIYALLSVYKYRSKFVSLNYRLAKTYPGWAQLLCGVCIWADKYNVSLDDVLMGDDI
ncbi:DUF7411 family protein [Bacterioplanoides sp.]|uniref:DUF7411 family protein n=1 Tax=Bacterioplanoides sp. TaxID=2066072 RepID=UPI003B5B4165